LADRAAIVLNIMDFGGSTAAADNSAAFNAALALHSTTGRPIYFPAGVWKFTGAITYTLPNATDSLLIMGAAMDATVLQFGATNGITINYLGYQNSTHWRGLTITTSGASAGSAITLTQTVPNSNPANTALSDFLNITIRGADGYAGANYWTNGILVNSVANINFNNVTAFGTGGFQGVGVNLASTASNIGVQYNFNGCTFDYNDKGIIYGAYVQGVTVTACNFTGGNYGIYSGTPTATNQLVVNSSQFNNRTAGIEIDGNMAEFFAVGNLFILNVNGCWGIHIAGIGSMVISNNIFQQSGGITGSMAIVYEAEVTPSVITGNWFAITNIGSIWLPTAGRTYNTTFANNVYTAGTVATFGTGATAILDTPQAFGQLPAASGALKWRTAFVVDSTTAVWGATVTGGGANNVLVVCDGSAWTVIGK
jgi:hypothetical protein